MGLVVSGSGGNGYTKVGTGPDGFKVWEPADEWKGAFARGYMYMATAYQDFTWSGPTYALNRRVNSPTFSGRIVSPAAYMCPPKFSNRSEHDSTAW